MAARFFNDTKLPAYALKPDGTLFVGSGIQGDNFYRSFDEDRGVSVALSVVHRQGASYEETSITGFDNTVHFNVNAGPQIGNPARAEWSLNYAAMIEPKFGSTDINAKTDIHLLIDVDPTDAVKYLDLILKDDPSQVAEHLIWVAANDAVVPTGTTVISDDGQNPGANVVATENSQNIAFYLGLMTQPYAFGAGAEFDFIMAETVKGSEIAYNTSTGNITNTFFDHGHNEVTFVGLPKAQVHMQVDVVNPI